MFVVEYYTKNEHSDVYDFVKEVVKKKDSDAKRMIHFLNTLEEHGPYIAKMINNSVKQIDGKLFELRPGNNRVFYFYTSEEKVYLLLGFRKQSDETPKGLIKKAKKRMNELIEIT